MFTENDWRDYLAHSWGKKPEQKAAEKAYNAKYYREHKEKWSLKNTINRPSAKDKWTSDDHASDLLSKKYNVDFNKLKLSDPKVLLIAISEATNQRRSLNVFDNAAKKLATDVAKYGSFKFTDLFKKKEPTPTNDSRPRAREKNITGSSSGSIYRRDKVSGGSVGRR